MASLWNWPGIVELRAPADVWYAPETLLWLAALLALPALTALTTGPGLQVLLAWAWARRPQAAYLTHPWFRWALLCTLAGWFAAWEGWRLVSIIEPGSPGTSRAIVNPRPGLSAASYLALMLGLGLGMFGYVAALGCSAEGSRRHVGVEDAMRQAWLAGAGIALFMLGGLAAYTRVLLALPLLAGAVVLLTVQARRGKRLAALAKARTRVEQAAEAAALAGQVAAQGEYRGEGLRRPLLRIGRAAPR